MHLAIDSPPTPESNTPIGAELLEKFALIF